MLADYAAVVVIAFFFVSYLMLVIRFTHGWELWFLLVAAPCAAYQVWVLAH